MNSFHLHASHLSDGAARRDKARAKPAPTARCVQTLVWANLNEEAANSSQAQLNRIRTLAKAHTGAKGSGVWQSWQDWPHQHRLKAGFCCAKNRRAARLPHNSTCNTCAILPPQSARRIQHLIFPTTNKLTEGDRNNSSTQKSRRALTTACLGQQLNLLLTILTKSLVRSVCGCGRTFFFLIQTGLW